MKFEMNVDMNNAAFENSIVVGNLIKMVAEDVLDGIRHGTVKDSNGNIVGEWSIR